MLGIVANAQPYSEALLGGFYGTLYVLEVNGGYAAQRITSWWATGSNFRVSIPHTDALKWRAFT